VAANVSWHEYQHTMITLWLYSLPLLGVAGWVFWLMRRRALWLRLVVAGVIWLLPPLALTALVFVVGGHPPQDAVTVVPGSAAKH
jgi:hypothetical protein